MVSAAEPVARQKTFHTQYFTFFLADEVSSFDQSNQIEVNDYSYDVSRIIHSLEFFLYLFPRMWVSLDCCSRLSPTLSPYCVVGVAGLR
jgi:hypothetical protein